MSSEVNLQQADLPRSKGYLNFRTPHLLKPPSKAQRRDLFYVLLSLQEPQRIINFKSYKTDLSPKVVKYLTHSQRALLFKFSAPTETSGLRKPSPDSNYIFLRN